MIKIISNTWLSYYFIISSYNLTTKYENQQFTHHWFRNVKRIFCWIDALNGSIHRWSRSVCCIEREHFSMHFAHSSVDIQFNYVQLSGRFYLRSCLHQFLVKLFQFDQVSTFQVGIFYVRLPTFRIVPYIRLLYAYDCMLLYVLCTLQRSTANGCLAEFIW